MRLYGTEGGFARREGAPVWRGEVCLFAPAELEAVHLPALVRLLLPAQARYCRAGTEGAALVGAVKRSAGSFTFALWEGNLAVCDEGDFVQGVLDGLLGRPLTAGGALCAALADAAARAGIEVRRGLVASGDQFIASAEQIARIRAHFDAQAAEMEGGAIGQVCTANGVPFAVLRAISDGGNEEAKMSYPQFVQRASERSVRILMEYLQA